MFIRTLCCKNDKKRKKKKDKQKGYKQNVCASKTSFAIWSSFSSFLLNTFNIKQASTDPFRDLSRNLWGFAFCTLAVFTCRKYSNIWTKSSINRIKNNPVELEKNTRNDSDVNLSVFLCWGFFSSSSLLARTCATVCSWRQIKPKKTKQNKNKDLWENTVQITGAIHDLTSIYYAPLSGWWS